MIAAVYTSVNKGHQRDDPLRVVVVRHGGGGGLFWVLPIFSFCDEVGGGTGTYRTEKTRLHFFWSTTKKACEPRLFF
jgi:hypothetical protein